MLSTKRVRRPSSKCVVDLVYLPVEKKHELVEHVAENTPGKSEPVAYLNETDLYDGKIGSIPNSTTGLMRLSSLNLELF